MGKIKLGIEMLATLFMLIFRQSPVEFAPKKKKQSNVIIEASEDRL